MKRKLYISRLRPYRTAAIGRPFAERCRQLLFLIVACLALHACDDLTDINESTGGETPPEAETSEIYILNEGLFNLNNSTLVRHSFADNRTVPDYFRILNRRGLGDTANDMQLYGSKLYIVVNVSSIVEVIDLRTGLSLKQIPIRADNGSSRQPRSIAFYENKAYVCSFDGTVARIDTTSLDIDGLVNAGRNPDGICVQNGKLYVSNSGGLDAGRSIGVDRTVSVIDPGTLTKVKDIEVGPNPGKILPGPDGGVLVVIRGEDLTKGNYRLVQIDSRTDAVTKTYEEKVLNFAVNDELAYLYNYNYQTQTASFKVFNLRTGTTERENFITDGTKINTPYAIQVNPFNGNVYITDVYSYVVKGDVLCFSPQGQLQFRLSNIGMNPNTLVFSDTRSQSNIDDEPVDDNAPTAFANKVWEYVPAPGQFINTTTSAYKDGFDSEQVLNYATERIKDKSLLSLGGFGGYIVLGFAQSIRNVQGEYDFKVYGNASYNMYGTATGKPGGSSEPGIVLVSKDVNGNGLPDDPWYELAGSEYGKSTETRGYKITYYRPEPANGDVRWRDNQGNEGYVTRNTFHKQVSYYPVWMDAEITFRGTRLADNAVQESGQWVGYCYAWGYADNHPNSTDLCKFKIDWAVNEQGKPVTLDAVDFVKIYCAVNQGAGVTGELSTEVMTVEDLHFK